MAAFDLDSWLERAGFKASDVVNVATKLRENGLDDPLVLVALYPSDGDVLKAASGMSDLGLNVGNGVKILAAVKATFLSESPPPPPLAPVHFIISVSSHLEESF